MVRPRKPEAELRSRTICVRVTTEEALMIAERLPGRPTKDGCLRRARLEQSIRTAAVHRHRIRSAQTAMWSGIGSPPGVVILMLVGLSVPLGVQWKYRADPARTRRPARRGTEE